MMTLFGAFHTIAAQRGDGLRPELIRAITGSATLQNIGASAITERASEGEQNSLPPLRVVDSSQPDH